MRHILASAIALALTGAAGTLSAQPVTAPAAAEVTTQLPRTARPSHYAVEVTPHADTMSFDGKVRIDIDVLAATDRIVLQAVNMRFAHATLAPAKGKPLAATVSVDADSQTATFAFAKPLAPGKYVLSTEYAGKINTQANGLFALDYATPDGQKRALYTQFENSDARRFIPSWDEPDYKATFDLTVVAPAAQMAVSNMPVARS